MKTSRRIFKNCLIALSVSLFSIAGISCSSDNDNENGPSNPNQPGSGFVGAWEGEMGYFIFFDGGYAKFTEGNVSNYIRWGAWQFNDETNILATTLDNWQFLVTLQAPNDWAAMSLKNEKTYSFERLDDIDCLYAQLIGARLLTTVDGETYEGEITNKTYSVYYNTNYIKETVGISGYKGLYLGFMEGKDGLEYKAFTYEGQGANGSIYKFYNSGTVKIKNRYSATNLTLQLTPNYPVEDRDPVMTLTIDNVNHK